MSAITLAMNEIRSRAMAFARAWQGKHREEAEAQIAILAQAVLEVRAQFPSSSLADLYDPRTMPPVLSKAHARLDAAVDKLYSRASFPDDNARVAHLFSLYQAQI